MKKRVRLSQEFVNKLFGYKEKHTKTKILCSRFLYKDEGRYGGKVSDVPSYRIYIRAKIIPYVLILPFVLLLEFFWCLWDGGLKTFRWPSLVVENRTIYADDHSMYFECTNKWLREVKD